MKITVNGRQHAVDVDDDTPLLWILRDNLSLTGTKYGCGIGPTIAHRDEHGYDDAVAKRLEDYVQ